MRSFTIRALLFSLATLIGIYEGILFFRFDTVSPCEALSLQVLRLHEQARSELGLSRRILIGISVGAVEGEQHEERQALGISDPATPLHCVFALWKISSDYQGSVEMAKNRWRAETEAQRAQSEGKQ